MLRLGATGRRFLLAEARELLERVVSLDPENATAKVNLERLREAADSAGERR